MDFMERLALKHSLPPFLSRSFRSEKASQKGENEPIQIPLFSTKQSGAISNFGTLNVERVKLY